MLRPSIQKVIERIFKAATTATGGLVIGLGLLGASQPATLEAADAKKPNILFIMADDIGWMQPSCYHRGLMVGETPNIDRIAKEGATVHGLLRVCRVAPPGVMPSSPACIRCVRA